MSLSSKWVEQIYIIPEQSVVGSIGYWEFPSTVALNLSSIVPAMNRRNCQYNVPKEEYTLL